MTGPGSAAARWLWVLTLVACTQRVSLPAEVDALSSNDDAAHPDVPAAPVDAAEPDRVGLSTDSIETGTADRLTVDTETDTCRMPRTEPLAFFLDSPEAIIAMDRSSSMRSVAIGEWPRLKVVQEAVRAAILRYQSTVRFGYEEFPVRCSSTDCCAGRVSVLPAPGNLAAIDRQIRCEVPFSCSDGGNDSPADQALERCRDAYASGSEGGRSRFVILITDGEPSCMFEASSCERTVARAVQLLGSGIRTLVLAIGDEVKASQCLDSVALAGLGGARTKTPAFMWAGDEKQIQQQVEEAVATVAQRSCRATLRSQSGLPPPERLAITVGGVPVPRDPEQQDGWNFDPPNARTTIMLFGSHCDRLRASPSPATSLRVTATFCR